MFEASQRHVKDLKKKLFVEFCEQGCNYGLRDRKITVSHRLFFLTEQYNCCGHFLVAINHLLRGAFGLTNLTGKVNVTLVSRYSLIFLASVRNASSMLMLLLHDTSKNGMSKSSAIWNRYFCVLDWCAFEIFDRGPAIFDDSVTVVGYLKWPRY